MADTKTTLEVTRSPIDGTELVRLATVGANWKVTIAALGSFILTPPVVLTDIANPASSTLTLTGGTALTTSQPVLNMTQGWNNAAIQFKGIRLVVTGTALSSNSFLGEFLNTSNSANAGGFHIQSGGGDNNQLILDCVAGGRYTGSYITNNGALRGQFYADNNNGAFYVQSLNAPSLLILGGGDGNTVVSLNSNALTAVSGASIGFSSSTNILVDPVGDTLLFRDAAGIFAQRNGVNPQTLRVYNTFTNSTNFERGIFDWNKTANVLTIGTEKGSGGGVARNLQFIVDGVVRLDYGVTSPNVWYVGALLATASSSFIGGDLRVDSAQYVYWNTRSLMSSPSNGNILFQNSAATDFGLLQFGGTTASFPALRRSAATIQCRLADDSGDADFKARLLQTAGFTVATLPAAGTAGRMAYVTDALAPTFLATVVGGGAIVTPVFDNGTNWVGA